MSLVETNPQIELILTTIRNCVSNINTLDAKLGTDDKSEQTKRKEIANELVANNDNARSLASSVVSKISENFDVSNAGEIAAVVSAIRNKLAEAFGTKVTDFLNAEVKVRDNNAPKPAELSDVERKELLEERNKQFDLIAAHRNILSIYEYELPEDIVVPTKGRATGPRGADFRGDYRIFVDNIERDKIQGKDKDGNKVMVNPSLAQIASQVCKPLGWSTKDLKDNILKSNPHMKHQPGKTADSPGYVNPVGEWKLWLPPPVEKELKGVLESVEGQDDSNDDTPESNEED